MYLRYIKLILLMIYVTFRYFLAYITTSLLSFLYKEASVHQTELAEPIVITIIIGSDRRSDCKVEKI